MILSYSRVSSLAQGKQDRCSIGEQQKRCRVIAQMREQVGKYQFAEFTDIGISGSVPLSQRPGGKALLAQAQQGDIICASKLDRIFRSASDALRSIERLKKQGIGLIICDIGLDPVADSPSASLFFGMLSLVAQFERERIAERISEGRAAKKARGGCIGYVPFGYRKVGTGKASMLVLDEKEQEHISAARYFRNKLWQRPTGHWSRYRMTDISEAMAKEGMLGRDGKPYSAMAVWRMTTSERVPTIDPPVADVETVRIDWEEDTVDA